MRNACVVARDSLANQHAREAVVNPHDRHGEELFSVKVKAGSRTYFVDAHRVAKLWNLSASDLAEIQRSLGELAAG